MSKLRLGIDVGGTFTDVVAIDADTREVTARVKVPTTHDAPEGVAAGIVRGIRELFAQHALQAEDVAFIAHSTTQATNALLEGDVASVGILGLLDTLAPLARAQMHFPRVTLAPGIDLRTKFAFVRAGDLAAIDRELDALRGKVDVIAVSAAFGVDRPGGESAAAGRARSRGFEATCGHEVSSMYGLRARTRTAALNAAMLPKMIKTARMTSQSVRDANIGAPLMVMRSDGGVMDVREMERRPILTLLSGPAAGIAGALLHENVTDGIFIEVGGTSADCSAIRAGMPQMRPARVGGHRTMLSTLDVRTLAIAGGSMLRMRGAQVLDAGPRSAHIAGCRYAAFTPPADLDGARVAFVKPAPHDPDDYVVLECRNGLRVAPTTTCAANMLGFVPEGAFALGDSTTTQRAFEIVAQEVGSDAETIASAMLDAAAAKVIAAIEELAADYALDRDAMVIVGGGGGAAALIPYAAKKSSLPFRLARDAEVISPIGVALALVRESVERTIVDPSPDDILALRRTAQDAVVAAGAAPEQVIVAVEIDPQRNIVRAIASGALEIAESASRPELDDEGLRAAAADLLRAQSGAVRLVAQTPLLGVFETVRSKHRNIRVLDRHGVGRLAARDAAVRATSVSNALAELRDLIEGATAFGDVGRALPDTYVLHGARIADFSGLASAEQIVALAEEELAGRDASSPVVLLAAPRPA